MQRIQKGRLRGWTKFIFWLGALLSEAVLAPWPASALMLRAPAVPLVAHDPYFSIWSAANNLTDTPTTHWTGTAQALRSLVRVDGQVFRVMGVDPSGTPALTQAQLQELPTRTIYGFTNANIALTLTFLTPALPSNLDVLSRPLTYLNWDLQSTDGLSHSVQIYFDAGPEIAVNSRDQSVVWSRPTVTGQTVLQISTANQWVLDKSGDNLRIDWGSLYVATTTTQQPGAAIVPGTAAWTQFALNGQLPAADDTQQPCIVSNNAPVLAMTFDLGSVGASVVSRQVMVAYDDLYSILYFGQPLQPYWRRNGATAADLLEEAASDYPALAAECRAFDTDLMADLTTRGGDSYAQLCVLAYRQTLAGNKIVADANGQPLMFPKECFSNGCIGTVDVLFPQAPFYLTFSPALIKAMLTPILDYASSRRWKFVFSPHDLGTYPWATGQVYGGGEQSALNQMPDEETGNLLIMMAALARSEGKVNSAAPYWPLLRQWADYLVANGLDPADQLCSADMFGPLAHSTDLAQKAIIGIGAYGQLCNLAGRTDEAQNYMTVATNYAAQWRVLAADTNHMRLAYDQPGTWSMKHNLIWDRVLGLNLFPNSVGDEEIAWYLDVQNTYGLPVDDRTTTSLIDWAMWSIALARNTNDFLNLLAPICNYANNTPNRVPLSDWFSTLDATQQGFQARPVVGGLFIKMLTDWPTWSKWAGLGADVSGPWAPFPVWEPSYTVVVPTAQNETVTWRYTTNAPAGKWYEPDFDDSGWSRGPAGFGTVGTPGAIIGTVWSTSDIWIRREFTLGMNPLSEPRLLVHHDETATIYVNGISAAVLPGCLTSYQQFSMDPAAAASLLPGTNMLAVQCHQTTGGQYIDVGVVEAPPLLAASQPALTNLVAFWPLNVDASDVLGAHNGQLAGTLYRAVGPAPAQGAFYLDGNSYIVTGTNYGSLFDGAHPFSAAAWIRGDAANNDATVIGKMIQGGPYTGWELHVGTPAGGSGPGLLNVWLINNYGPSYIQVNSPIPILDGTWHHVAFTYDGSRGAAGVKIYVDGVGATGVATADSLAGSLVNSVDLDLGTRQDGAFHNFTGSLREVSLWSIALHPGNVAWMYQSGPPWPPLRLTNPQSLTPSTFGFGWNSVMGTAYQIQSSSNLVNWTIVQDLYPTGGATGTNTSYAGGIVSPGMSFYRVRPLR